MAELEKAVRRPQHIPTPGELIAYAKRFPTVYVSPKSIKPYYEGPESLSGYSMTKGPIIVDKNTMQILDGNHRYWEWVEEGAKEIPVKLIDYEKVPHIG